MTNRLDGREVVRVLVADDSATVRQYLAYLLGEDPGIEVVGMAADGVDAVAQTTQLKPDVVVMDVHMPRMGGLEATREIMQRVPTPIVMVSSTARRDDVAMTFDAIRVGALVALEKPGGFDDPLHAESARRLLDTVKSMAEVRVVRRWPKREPAPPPPRPSSERVGPIRLVTIGASTGGPQVLADILTALPASFPLPVLVVQHITAGFTEGLARWLTQITRLTVKVATASELVRPGRVYLAPEGVQMGIAKDGTIRLAAGRGEDGFAPSVTHLFESAADSYGRSAMGILLTGMGRDGAAGLRRLRDAGAVTIAQDKESSVIFGMPAEAIKLGAAQYVYSPEQITEMLGYVATAR